MFTPPVGDRRLPSAVTELTVLLQQINSKIIPRKSGPITFLSGFPDQSVRCTSSW